MVVGADREADGFQHAEDYGIPTMLVPWREFDSREEWGAELAEQLDVWKPDLVVLSGLMRLLPPSLVDVWSPKDDLLDTPTGAPGDLADRGHSGVLRGRRAVLIGGVLSVV